MLMWLLLGIALTAYGVLCAAGMLVAMKGRI